MINVGGMRARIEAKGVFGVASRSCFWPGFSAHTADPDKPFLSQTGYRGFLGVQATAQPGLTPDTFAADMLAAYTTQELQGRLLSIEPRYRERRQVDGA